MITFDISSMEGDLGAKHVTVSNVEKYRADFCAVLDRGVILASVTATVTAGASTASAAALSQDRKSATWLFHAAAVAEEASLALVVTTNDGQTLRYSVLYQVG